MGRPISRCNDIGWHINIAYNWKHWKSLISLTWLFNHLSCRQHVLKCRRLIDGVIYIEPWCSAIASKVYAPIYHSIDRIAMNTFYYINTIFVARKKKKKTLHQQCFQFCNLSYLNRCFEVADKSCRDILLFHCPVKPVITHSIKSQADISHARADDRVIYRDYARAEIMTGGVSLETIRSVYLALLT